MELSRTSLLSCPPCRGTSSLLSLNSTGPTLTAVHGEGRSGFQHDRRAKTVEGIAHRAGAARLSFDALGHLKLTHLVRADWTLTR